jgi:uncharacterized iron-regulated membrane protein
MLLKKDTSKQAKTIRTVRNIHKTMGVFLFVFFFIIAVTGILLGIKKHSNGFISDKNYQGTSTHFKDWISIDSLHINALQIARDSISPNLSPALERIDIRKDNGMVKFIFVDGFWAIQLDGVTGKLLHIEKRTADFIEQIHDGSILDYFFKTKNQIFKLLYSSILGFALLLFTLTGFWLWYGPKQLKKIK